MSTSASPSEDLTEREQPPPLAPTLLTFPSYTPQNPPSQLTAASCRDLFQLLCSVRKPQDITSQCLQALSLSVIPNAAFHDLYSQASKPDHDVSEHIPHQDRLQETIRELRTDHSHAFREVVRLPPLPGHSRPRLSRTRNFWMGLERMSLYWDCSMDKYYEVTEAVSEDDNGFSSSSSSSDSDTIMSNTEHHVTSAKPPSPLPPHTAPSTRTKRVYKGRRISTGSSMPTNIRDETVCGLLEAVVWAFNCQVRFPNLPPRLSVRNLLFPVRQSLIVGKVPRERESARRAVLEGPVMAACCRVETNFHDDRKEDGKAGDGDSMSEVAEDQRKAILDLAREVGVMLLQAQERAREGKEPVKPGEGKWWTVTPRWGGGPGGLMEDEVIPEQQLNEDRKTSVAPLFVDEAILQPSSSPPNPEMSPSLDHLQHSSPRPKRKANAEDPTAPPASHSNSSSSSSKTKTSIPHKRSSSSKPSLAEKWKTLRAGPSIWDPKMRYMRIGKPTPPKPPSTTAADTSAGSDPAANEEEDVIITLSSINHHVALLGMRVSDRCLAWLAGEGADSESHQTAHAPPNAQAEGLGSLVLRRTRWFDLFDEADRVEFVEGLWEVMAWLMRDG
jgi:hypothetical protein